MGEWDYQAFSDYMDAVMRSKKIADDAEVARRSGVGQTQIGRWRRGLSRPSMTLLDRLAAGLLVPKRNLYALAGYGLEDEAPVEIPPVLPAEIQDLVDLFNDPALTDDERASLLMQARLAARGLRAIVEERRSSEAAPPVRRGRGG